MNIPPISHPRRPIVTIAVVCVAATMLAAARAVAPALQFLKVDPFVEYMPPNGGSSGFPSADHLASFATPGQFEPLTCGVFSSTGAENVTVTATDLAMKDAVIPKGEIDLRILKYWYQRGPGFRGRYLVPAPLFHDDNLITVDTDKQENVRHFSGLPVDAAALAPFSVARNTVKQLWITIHVPPRAPAGKYRGVLVFKSGEAELGRMPLELEVLPFALDPPSKSYGVYFRSVLSPEKGTAAPGDSERAQNTSEVDEAVFREQCADLRAHGIMHPEFRLPTTMRPDGTLDTRRLERTINIRREFDLMQSPFFASGFSVSVADAAKDPALLDKCLDEISQVRQFFSAAAGVEPYIYGVDEAYGDKLRKAVAVYTMIKERGGLVAQACYTNNQTAVTRGTPGWLETAGRAIDLPIVAQNLTLVPPEEIRAAHALGVKLWLYALPQAWWSYYAPYEFRNNYGFWLSFSEADGICPWGYQYAAGDPYDDFDTPEGKINDCFAVFPTKHGILPTVMWEAYRAAIDDCRYETTLRNLVTKLRGRHGESPLLHETEAWMRAQHVDYVYVVNNLAKRKEVFKPMLVYGPDLKAQLAVRPNLQTLRRAYADHILEIIKETAAD
jgi:hypothetical protein